MCRTVVADLLGDLPDFCIGMQQQILCPGQAGGCDKLDKTVTGKTRKLMTEMVFVDEKMCGYCIQT